MLALAKNQEQTRLQELEIRIETGMQTFLSVGADLLEIRDSRLYKAAYATFEDYCRERWGMSRIHAHRLIESVKVSENLLPTGNIPATEYVVRPLVSLPPEQQREVWAEATQKAEAESRPVTARDVTDAVYNGCSRNPDLSLRKLLILLGDVVTKMICRH